jgi:hypothetical protein
MANGDRPNGFRPYGPIQSPAMAYQAGGTIYPGDAVKMNSSGVVVVAAAGDALLGVAEGKAASGEKVKVFDNPNQRFVGQLAGSEINEQTDIGNNCDIVATAGSSTYNLSRMEIDGSTQTAAGSAQVQILEILPAVGNSLGANVQVVFRINEHMLTEGKSGV